MRPSPARCTAIRLALLALFAASPALAPAAASATAEARLARRESVVFDGEWRLRGEAFDGYRLDKTSPRDFDDFWTSRLCLGVKPAKPGPVDWFVMFGSGSIYWSEIVDTRAVPARSQDRFNITHAWVSAALGGSGWQLKAGRQPLMFGDDTLLGGGNWNLRTLWDGVRLTRATPSWTLDLFDAKGVAHDDVRLLSRNLPVDLSGVHATRAHTLGPGGKLDLYFLKNVNRTTGADTRTLGARLYGKAGPVWEYDLEVPVQRGTYGGRDHRAGALRVQAFRVFAGARLKPRLGFEYRRATGDDPATTGRNESFDTLYATAHRHLGSMDYVNWTNVESIAFLTRFQATRRLSVDLNAFRFRLPEPSLGLAGRRPAAAQIARGLSDDAGVETDLTLLYKHSKDLEIMTGASDFAPGDFFRQAGNGRADRGRWFFFQATRRWQ